MVGRMRRFGRAAGAVALAAALAGSARAQSGRVSSEPVVMFNPSGQAVVVDPLAAQMLSGTGVPVTRAQAGMSAASSVGRFTGIGSGRASGVRGAVDPKTGAPAAAQRPTLRAPGGQASVYFNRYGRGTPVSVAAPASAATTRNYYNRPAGYFPAGVR